MPTIFALIAHYHAASAKLPHIPFTLCGASREAIEKFDVERQALRHVGWSDIRTTDTSGHFLLLKESGFKGEPVVEQIVVAAHGAGARAVMKIPDASANPLLLTTTNQTGPRGRTCVRVESTGQENALGIRALDIFGVEKVGGRQLRVRREHRDNHGRFTNDTSEFYVSDPPWRGVKAPSNDDVILDGKVGRSSVKLYTYNPKSDRFGEITCRFDHRAGAFDRDAVATRRLEIEEVRRLGLEADVTTLGGRPPEPKVPLETADHLFESESDT